METGAEGRVTEPFRTFPGRRTRRFFRRKGIFVGFFYKVRKNYTGLRSVGGNIFATQCILAKGFMEACRLVIFSGYAVC